MQIRQNTLTNYTVIQLQSFAVSVSSQSVTLASCYNNSIWCT